METSYGALWLWLMLIQAAAQTSPSSVDQLSYVARVADVSLSLNVTRRSDLAAPIIVSAELHNQSPRVIVTGSDNCVYKTLRLETADGKPVAMTKRGREAASRIQDVRGGSVRPGDRAQISFDLQELFEIPKSGVYKLSIAQTFLLANPKRSRALSIENVHIIVGDDVDIFSPD